VTAYEQVTATPGSSSTDVKDTAKAEVGNVAGTAKQEAGAVTQTAGQAASEVAGTAKEQIGNVAGEAKTQIGDLATQAKQQASQQASQQQQKAAQTVRGVADQLQGISRGEAPTGVAADIVQQISSRVQTLADRLENADPQELLGEVRRFARNKPGGFLLGAAAAGFLTGRMVKGAKGDDDSDDDFYGRSSTASTYDASAGTYGGTTYGTGTAYATGSDYTAGSEYASTDYGTAAGAPTSGVTTGYGTETPGYATGGFGTDETYPDEPRRADSGGTI